MASSETANRLQRWRQGYEKIAEISMAQLMLLKEEAVSDDLWARMRSLNDEKEAAQTGPLQVNLVANPEVEDEDRRSAQQIKKCQQRIAGAADAGKGDRGEQGC